MLTINLDSMAASSKRNNSRLPHLVKQWPAWLSLTFVTASLVMAYVLYQATHAAATGFVTRQGQQLFLNGAAWTMNAGSVYGGLGNPTATINQATAAELNTIRLVDFLDTNPATTAGPYDEARWAKVDALIAAGGSHNLKVLLDLSAYRNQLKAAGTNPYTTDWQAFFSFMAHRVNTVSGATYATDPTIAIIALAGEPDAPNASNPTVTSQQLTDYYTRSLAQLRALDSHHLIESGGFLQLNWNSGIDWRTIMGLANNDICSIHNYSTGDNQITTPNVASYCAGLGKPWITEEFGFNQTMGDSARATAFNDMYALNKQYNAAGLGFWNLGTEVIGVNGKTETYDVNANTPLTLAAVKAYSESINNTVVIGDADGNGLVNLVDLSLLLSHWGQNYSAADFNHDGTINLVDLSLLLGHWTG